MRERHPDDRTTAFGVVLRPAIAALSMSSPGVRVAVNALLLRRLQLPTAADSITMAVRYQRPRSRRS